MGLSGYSAKPSHYWVYQVTQPRQHSQLGLSGCPAKDHTWTNAHQDIVNPTHHWVYQATQPSQYTIGFIRLPSQANIRLGLSRCQPSQTTFGFIRLLRQWKVRMAKVVAHSRARDTSTRSIWPGIHNTYTTTTRKHPLLCYTVPWAMPSLLVLFRVCIEDSPATLIFS